MVRIIVTEEDRTVAQTMQPIKAEEQTDEAFKQSFCYQCRDYYICTRNLKTIGICKQLVNNGTWAGHFGRYQDIQ